MINNATINKRVFSNIINCFFIDEFMIVHALQNYDCKVNYPNKKSNLRHYNTLNVNVIYFNIVTDWKHSSKKNKTQLKNGNLYYRNRH